MDDLEYNLLTLFADGGLMMYFLVLCSLVALGVIIAKSYTLWLAHKDTETVLSDVRELTEQGRLDEAIQRCIETPGPTAAILLAGLRRIKDGKVREQDLEQAINTTGTIELGFLERGLVILATVANVAPLMGFLGTVAGMIMAFESIAVAGDVDPTLVAGGIKVALLTTATGLLIAIPTNIGYNFFVTRIDRLILDMEQGTQQLLNLVWDMDRRGDLEMVRQGGAPTAAMAGAGVGPARRGTRGSSSTQASQGEPASPPAPTADQSVKKNKPGN